MAEGPGRVDAVVSVSAPAFWYYRGTRIMRVAHWMVETRPGRLVMRVGGTRITSRGWSEPHPIPPFEAAALLGPIPLLVVHGDADHYFPLEHPRAIHEAALRSGVRTDLWIERGFGHAESAVSTEILDRIGAWARECAGRCARFRDTMTGLWIVVGVLLIATSFGLWFRRTSGRIKDRPAGVSAGVTPARDDDPPVDIEADEVPVRTDGALAAVGRPGRRP